MDPVPVVFFDLETRSKCNITRHGAARYARDPSTDIICIAARFPDGRKGVWAPPEYAGEVEVAEWLPDAWDDWVDSGGLVVAWNAAFDYGVMHWLEKRENCPLLAPRMRQTLCAQALAESYSLPGKLGQAAKTLRVPIQKDKSGAAFIRKYCDANQDWSPSTAQLREFFRYALHDVEAMRGVWRMCRPWCASEWEDYHVVQAENARGMLIDVDFAAAATRWADVETASLNTRLQALTGDPDITLSHSKRKVDWLRDKLEGTDLEPVLLVKRKRKKATVKAYSADKSVQRLLLQSLDDSAETGAHDLDAEVRAELREFLSILDEGNGVATKKFGKIVDVHCDGRLHDQWRCSPTITGRHAARGVQLDNVVRAKLKGDGDPAIDAIDLIMSATSASALNSELQRRYGLPLQQVLARLIRPCIMASEGQFLVWGDWSAIEARVLPWLAGAQHALEPYIIGQCVYSQAASAIYGDDWRDIYSGYKAGDQEMQQRRQIGKVATLAFGYGGGVGAFLAMATNYGIKTTEEKAEQYKQAWRAANRWAVRFWRDLNDAAWRAWQDGIDARVGKLTYRRVGRDLWCILPSGRPIVYPEAKAEDKYKEAWDSVVRTLTYRKVWQGGAVRGELYGGILAENVTQGAAACLLREVMKRLDREGYALIGTTHDEVRIESTQPKQDAEALKAIMEDNPAWAVGLPLAAEVEWASYYGK